MDPAKAGVDQRHAAALEARAAEPVSYRAVSSGEPVSQLWMLEAPLAKHNLPKVSMSSLRQASAPCSTHSNSL